MLPGSIPQAHTGRAKRVRFELTRGAPEPRQPMPVIPLKGFLREAGLSGYEYALRVRAPCSGA